MNEEILKIIKEKGILLERELFELLNSFNSSVKAKDFLERLERYSGHKIITKNTLIQNMEFVHNTIGALLGNEKDNAEKIIVKLGLQIEISKEYIGDVKNIENKKEKSEKNNYSIFYADTKIEKKLEVSDFTSHFRSRYQQLQKILMQRPDLQNLISINKISSQRQNLFIIGMLKEKRKTKNNNMILIFEDLTGEISVLAKPEREEAYSKALELQLDDIVAIKASGNRDILFMQDIFFPDSFVHEKIKFEEERCIAFLSDMHCGSDRHLQKSFERFLDWINSEDELAKKIDYIFFVGDNVDGVGIFPGQENFLKLKSMKEQYTLLASYLKRIPKRIIFFMCPGQHDAVRVAEPQPIIDRKYASALYEIDNLILVTNPTLVKLYEKDKEFKVLMYHGASIHTFINEISELREAKAHRTPARAVKHMLKRRHLAPTHSSVVYIPYQNRDPLVISESPDILCTGEVHRLDIENYNGTIIITGSCWQAQTPFEEKVGNIPDPAKMPVFNLKTRELKVLDFGVEEEINKEYG